MAHQSLLPPPGVLQHALEQSVMKDTAQSLSIELKRLVTNHSPSVFESRWNWIGKEIHWAGSEIMTLP